MPNLRNISKNVQQVAEAISAALGIEAEIVDSELTIIAGTNFYKKRIGKKEESGDIGGNYLYARVLRDGKTVVVEDAKMDPKYDPSNGMGTTKELAEICTPIKANSNVIGVIGLIAFEKVQQDHLVKNQEKMIFFLEKMAELLASKSLENTMLNELETTKNEIMTIMETIHEGMLAVDKKGYITYHNSIAQALLKSTNQEMKGKHLSEFMPNTSILDVIKSGIGYTEQEKVFKTAYNNFHFIVTVKPFCNTTENCGAVISFRDIMEAHKLVYNMSKNKIQFTFQDIIGSSEAIIKAKNQALCVARGNSTVLITGESGTGKEIFAKSIHYASSRQNGQFVTVNCGAIPETLLESELFGYEAGAFTGANPKGKIGKFEQASGGTIFLDEIGEMPLHLQVKLLHVLQNKRFEKVGGTKTIYVDVRVIAATNRDLEEMIREKIFREDLYYRLSVIPLRIPPLRNRGNDITMLMEYFLKKYNTFMSKNIKGFSKQVEELYYTYDWPGNVRELENAIEYGVNMTFGDEVSMDAVPPRIKKLYRVAVALDSNCSLQDQIKKLERQILMNKIMEYGTSRSDKIKIAQELGISRATLYRKLDEHKLS